MMRADDFIFHVNSLRTKITGLQQITILRICSLEKSESKEIIADKNLSQVCLTKESESKRVIINESYTEERES